MKRDRRLLRDACLLFALALVLRLAAQAHQVVIARDALGYLESARIIARGEWAAALGQTYPPGFPAWLALAGTALGGVDEHSARPASALLAALLAPLVLLLGLRVGGPVAARFAGLLAAILPLLVDLGAEVIADMGYLVLVAGALLLTERARASPRPAPLACAGAAALAGLAYLTRPEGIVALGALLLGLVALPRDPAARGAGRRALDAAAFLAPALLVALPFLLFIRERSLADGTLGGVWKLTLKRDLSHRLALLGPSVLLERVWFVLSRFPASAGPALPLLLIGLLTRPRAGSPAARRLLQLGLLVVAALLGAVLLVRTEGRFLAPTAALLLPWAGLGTARLVRWVAGHVPRPALLLALLLLLPCTLSALRTRERDKHTFHTAAALLRGAEVRRVLAFDSRLAHYADAELISLWQFFPGDPGVFDDPAVIASAVASTQPDACVLEVDQPAGAAASAELARRLGVTPLAVRGEGQKPLDVFLLGPR